MNYGIIWGIVTTLCLVTSMLLLVGAGTIYFFYPGLREFEKPMLYLATITCVVAVVIGVLV